MDLSSGSAGPCAADGSWGRLGRAGRRSVLSSPGHLDAHRHFVLDRNAEEQRWIDVERGERCRDRSLDSPLAIFGHLLEGDSSKFRRLSGKVDFQVSSDRLGSLRLLGQPRTHGNHRKLPAERHLQHVQIPVGVARIERLDRNRDQEVALTGLARTSASSRVADAIGVVERVRHVIRQSGLHEDPSVTGTLRGREKQQQGQENLRDHDYFRVSVRMAAPYAMSVVMPTTP